MRLNLTLKVQWYNLIESGIKKEEYREIKPHWTSRIWNKREQITEVLFTDYHRQMVFRVNSITIGQPRVGWTANPFRTVYIIHLGERIE